MTWKLRSAAFALVALVAFAAGCADQPTRVDPLAPPRVAVGGPLLSTSSATEVVQVLKRTVPLETDVVRSAVIGSAGGIIDVPEAGLRLVVPTGAVSAPTAISVTALAGPLVAYTFEPHGIVFSEVVSAEQSLFGTEATTATYVSSRGYFSSSDAIDWETSTAAVTQVSLVQPEQAGASIKFYLNHFSGYLIAVD